MTAEPLIYDSSFFVSVLGNKIYLIKNTVEVNRCLEDIYKEENKWIKVGEETGVVEDNVWSPLNFLPSNYVAMTIVLNRVNELLAFVENKSIKEILTDEGDILPATQLDFMKNHINNTEGFESEFNRFHKLLYHFKEQILSKNTLAYQQIIILLNSSIQEDQSTNLFIKNIQIFFPNASDLLIIKRVGNVDGIEAEFNYRGEKITVHIKEASKIEKAGEYYKVYCLFNAQVYSASMFYIFTLPNNYIYIFENDKTKIRNVEGNEIFNKTPDAGLAYLFHSDILKNYLKVF